jgi:hypothetical protein
VPVAAAHFFAVRGETINSFPVAAQVHPDSTTRRARRRRVLGVSRVLSWDMEASGA